MSLFAISDLHLAFNEEKPMDIFGDNWYMHHEKIKENWIKKIKKEDTVLIAGDISWSMSMEEGLKDLEWIHSLPGKKIFIKGNHDYWWTSISKLNKLYDDMSFIQNNFFKYEDYAICGTRGWIQNSSEKFTTHDEKVYKRELIRLKLSLDAAVKDNMKKIIVMIHYPPYNDEFKDSDFTEVFKEYKVEKVIYGHLHGINPGNDFFNRIKDDIEYMLTSCDYLEFDPVKLL